MLVRGSGGRSVTCKSPPCKQLGDGCRKYLRRSFATTRLDRLLIWRQTGAARFEPTSSDSFRAVNTTSFWCALSANKINSVSSSQRIKRITASMHNMQEPATAPWDLIISDADLQKLKAGFEPQDQDDKWRVSVTDQSPSGNFSVHLARSGTGKELYILAVKPSDGSSSGSSGGAKIEAITWEQNKGGIRISEEQGKKEAVIISRSVLECDFDALPDYDVSDMWNHPAAQIDAK
ncbi:unnamed protein product [Periconia digitata]|uniref:Uncharacterized protein n=1 Tax=Periconia digitata TaxID=1303443 RepID=A0A9W4UER4_9PLEO|nr:unnamed protein product [Periconia digitata]